MKRKRERERERERERNTVSKIRDRKRIEREDVRKIKIAGRVCMRHWLFYPRRKGTHPNVLGRECMATVIFEVRHKFIRSKASSDSNLYEIEKDM